MADGSYATCRPMIIDHNQQIKLSGMTMPSLIEKHRKSKSTKQIWYVTKSITLVAMTNASVKKSVRYRYLFCYCIYNFYCYVSCNCDILWHDRLNFYTIIVLLSFLLCLVCLRFIGFALWFFCWFSFNPYFTFDLY